MLSERHVFDAPGLPARLDLGHPRGAFHAQLGQAWSWPPAGFLRLAEEVDIMAQILMPKATAVWLVENTTLTFEQVAAFCGLHPLEVQGIADGEVAIGIIGTDPTGSGNGQLSADEIKRCEQDPAARLQQAKVSIPLPQVRTKGP